MYKMYIRNHIANLYIETAAFLVQAQEPDGTQIIRKGGGSLPPDSPKKADMPELDQFVKEMDELEQFGVELQKEMETVTKYIKAKNLYEKWREASELLLRKADEIKDYFSEEELSVVQTFSNDMIELLRKADPKEALKAFPTEQAVYKKGLTAIKNRIAELKKDIIDQV